MKSPAADTFIRAYIEFIKEVLEKYGLWGYHLERKFIELVNVLQTTSHLVKVTNVKEAVSFCFYNAKLAEFFGIARIYHTSTPGKGSDVHKLLAFATTNLFKKSVGEIDDDAVRRSVEEAFNFMNKLSLADKQVEENKDLAVSMLSGLVKYLRKEPIPQFGITQETRLKAIAENQLIDYFLHIVGVPDLVLEFEVEGQKKAVVVDWKTGENSKPNIARDMHQLILYSILELIRLGYVDKYLEKNMPAGILENLVTDSPYKLKVLPLVVYGKKGVYSFHPAFPVTGYRRVLKLEEFEWEVRRSIYATIYLLTRVVNLPYLRALQIVGGERKDKEFREIFWESKKFFNEKVDKYPWYMYVPRDVRLIEYGKAGDHKRKDGEWHWKCKMCPYSNIDEKKDICRFYFTFDGKKVKDRINSTIGKLSYKYRYDILAEKERTLFLNSIPAFLASSYGGLLSVISSDCLAFVSNERFPRDFYCRKDLYDSDQCLRIILNRNKLVFGVYEVKSAEVDYSLYLELCRRRMACEKENVVIPYKPVLVASAEEVPYPSLAINTFTKALPLWEKINDERVCIRLVPISPTMRFSLINFINTIKVLDIRTVFVVEQNADLTSIDLRAIDAFHRALTLYKDSDDVFLQQFSTILGEGLYEIVVSGSDLEKA